MKKSFLFTTVLFSGLICLVQPTELKTMDDSNKNDEIIYLSNDKCPKKNKKKSPFKDSSKEDKKMFSCDKKIITAIIADAKKMHEMHIKKTKDKIKCVENSLENLQKAWELACDPEAFKWLLSDLIKHRILGPEESKTVVTKKHLTPYAQKRQQKLLKQQSILQKQLKADTGANEFYITKTSKNLGVTVPKNICYAKIEVLIPLFRKHCFDNLSPEIIGNALSFDETPNILEKLVLDDQYKK